MEDPMYFADRTDAGQKLAEALLVYEKRKDAVVVGLPRGGVVVAFEVAKRLHLPLDIICPRKIGAPSNGELAIGAVTETGQGMMNRSLVTHLGVPEAYVQQESAREQRWRNNA